MAESKARVKRREPDAACQLVRQRAGNEYVVKLYGRIIAAARSAAAAWLNAWRNLPPKEVARGR